MAENDRRKFLKKVALTGAVVASGTLPVCGSQEPSFSILTSKYRTDDASIIKIGLIGAGGMGSEDTNTCLKHKGVQLVAVCDLYLGRLEDAKKKWGSDLFLTQDYKALLAKKEIDAVIIGTPDHWHMQISIDALNAGKHVYCEKPMVHQVSQGHELINAWKKSGKVFQVGSQGMSSLGNEKARELLAQGAIGELNYAEGFWARHSPSGAWQYPIPVDGTEKTVDWNRFIANTTKRPFEPLRFFRWRNYLDYGTGMSGDLFVHLFSSLHFITNSLGPNQISAMGGLRYWKDGREVPDVLLGMFQYPVSPEHPGFNLSLRCNFVDGTSGTTYLKLVGSKGSMDVKWEEVVLRTNVIEEGDDFAQQKAAEANGTGSNRKKMVGPTETIFKAEEGYMGAHYDHLGNFLNAIRTGGQVPENPIFGFRAAAPALLCNDSYNQNKFINWDPINMKVV